MGRRKAAGDESIARSRLGALAPSSGGEAGFEPGFEPGWRRWVPAGVRDAAVGPGRRGLAVLAVVGMVVAVLAGVVAWRGRPASEPVAAASVVAEPGPVPGETSPSGTASPVVAVVAVAGKVRRPGLVRLPPGSRVADAVDAAGGALPGADLSTLNLARKVVDGELIAVGAPVPAGADGTAAAPGPGADGPLDLNTATAAQFDGLPGVGPVLAERIVAYRTEHGGFRSVDQLREVDGIGDSRFEKLRELVRV
ncbi:ComEA family DNA-binding protein [Cryptosporangium sp. NPDC051539]|uniref:ComEA family DNA-binding protein n=1 Tax=Cryptosporangium sp. NPDC051539 TaxID=3363962 RepID=UPI0037AAD5FE